MFLLLQTSARRRVLPALIAVAIGFSPVQAFAATDLTVGGEAVIAQADGDDVRLRTDPGYDADIIDLYPEGTTVNVLGGPVEEDDGSLWYEVEVDGTTGFMVSDYLWEDAGSGAGTTTSTLNLRAGPSTADDVILVMPSGATVSIDGDPENGFYPVTYQGESGWAHNSYLEIGGDPGELETTTVLSSLNLRSGPSTDDNVLEVMPGGAIVSLTGEQSDGFYEVIYQGTDGWAFGAYLEVGGSTDPVIDEAVTTDIVNFRNGPSTADMILEVIPAGETVETTGDAENGFYPSTYGGASGWVSADYLDFGGSGPVQESAIVWPVSGGEWMISQGYNGSSHVNNSSTWQYQNSFDIVKTNGDTAYQKVYSPVDGTIRWTEQSSGGITIDMGNGFAAAMFHMTVDSSLSDGDSLTQGQYIGYISGPGGNGNMGFDHLQLTVWATTDGGNWSREAIPFTGQNAIAGVEYPENGDYSQYYGTLFNP